MERNVIEAIEIVVQQPELEKSYFFTKINWLRLAYVCKWTIKSVPTYVKSTNPISNLLIDC